MTPSGVDSRFLQANERTLLAWIRTGLGLAGFGFVLAKSGALLELLDPSLARHRVDGAHVWLGIAFVAVGACTMALSLLRFRRVHDALVEGRPTGTSAATPLFLAGTTLALVVALGAWLLWRS